MMTGLPARLTAVARAKILLVLAGLLVAPASGAQDATVSVATSKTQNIVQLLRSTGSVTAPRAAMLSAAVGGLIARYAVDIGDAVTTGDLLVELDAELARWELESARAGAAQASAALADAQRRFAEAQRLSGQSSVIAETEVESRRAEVAVLEASLAVARATARQREVVVARHAVRAPFGGVVSERLAEIGEWVSPGNPLLRLVATADLQFDFRLPQSAFGSVTPQTPVTLSLDAWPGRDIVGRVAAIVPVNDPGDRTFMVRLVVDEAENDAGVPARIAPGMSARALISVDTGRSAVVVPRDAVLRYPDGRTAVWIVQQQDSSVIVRERRVTTGLEFDGLVEIRSGLEAGLQIVVRGNEALRDGQPVAVR